MGHGDRLGFRCLDTETEVDSLPVEGEIPGWLSGSLIRNGPAKWEFSRQRLIHEFEGLAMLYRFGFHDGEVSYANRFLESPQYRHVEEHGEIGYPEFASGDYRSLFRRLNLKSLPKKLGHNANINVHELAGRFVALTETPFPVEFDPETLSTVGVLEYGDGVEGVITSAHPHKDLLTGDSLNAMTRFSVNSSYKIFRVAAEDGRPRREVIAELSAPEPAYFHSFGQTENYVVLAECPLVMSPLKMVLNRKSYAENLKWRPERKSRFRVVDKKSGELVASRYADAFLCFHHVNAFEHDGEIVVDLAAHADASMMREPEESDPFPTAELRRYRIELEGTEDDQIGHRSLVDKPMEMPRMNYEHCNGRPYSYVYAVSKSHEQEEGWLDQLLKVDVRDGSSTTWHEDGCYAGEPVFVGIPSGTEEDEGVVLSVVLDSGRGRSFLLVLDAHSMQELARAWVPHNVPFGGFHGEYFPSGRSERVDAAPGT